MTSTDVNFLNRSNSRRTKALLEYCRHNTTAMQEKPIELEFEARHARRGNIIEGEKNE